MKIGYVGNFSQAHCTENHISATAEQLGHEVVRLQENELQPGQLASKVRGCDMLLWTRTWGGHVSNQDLRDVGALGIPTVSWHLDLYVGLQRESGLDDDPFWQTQYVFTPDGDPHSREVFQRKGVNHYYLKPGVYKPECEYGTYRAELAHDVVFVGGGIEYMHPEWPYRRQLVQWLMDNYSGILSNFPSVTRFGKYGHPQRVMRNQDLNDLYASAKVAVGDSVCIGFKHERYWSDRLYETLGRGGFLVHPYIVGLEDEFTLDGPDMNLVTYQYGGFDQLKQLIDYYVEHDHERERIRRGGHEFVKANCTYDERLQQLLETVFSDQVVREQRAEQGNPIDTQREMPLSFNVDMANTRLATVVDGVWHYEDLKINLGAGQDCLDGYVNVDMLDLPGIDVVHNLMQFPYPFRDESATDIRAVDVVEHLANYTADNRPSVIAFVEECHRVLKPGGRLFIQTPSFDAEFAWQDPTHVRPFHPKTFTLFDPEAEYGKTNGYYSHAKFKVEVTELGNHNLRIWMTKR